MEQKKMTFTEAIKTLRAFDPNDSIFRWARPDSWKGMGIAITLDVFSGDDKKLHYTGVILCVPHSRGGANFIPTVKEVLDNWEIVDSNTVLKGK
jgi:hypothetical protein